MRMKCGLLDAAPALLIVVPELKTEPPRALPALPERADPPPVVPAAAVPDVVVPPIPARSDFE